MRDMANSQNLVEHQFTSEKQPEGRGRPKGSPNRKRLLRAWLDLELEFDNPLKGLDAPLERMTVEDRICLALIAKALAGDLPSIQEVLNTLYGKIPDKVELDQNQPATVIFYMPENGR